MFTGLWCGERLTRVPEGAECGLIGVDRGPAAPCNYAASAARVILMRVARSRTPKPPPALHELEAEIMEEVWRQGEPTTVKLVMDALNRRAKPPRAYTTYMTVMRRLNDKGLLSRRRSGRSDTYEAALTREQYQDRR